ncbi:MAG: DUF2207 domain-containing protein, partial [Cyanobacteria bacterium]|nr:DUF2207 domain-containing protein [Cyanobacteriota bacterium]
RNGPETFRIHYMLRHAFNFEQGTPEFYWNICGSNNHTRIEQSTLRLFPPASVSTAHVRNTALFHNKRNDQPVVEVDEEMIYMAAGPIEPGEEFIVSFAFPKGVIEPPSLLSTTIWLLADWWPAFIIPALVTLGLVAVWWYCGMVASHPQESVYEAQPPRELSPAEVGTLIDESCDFEDVLATIIDLAARGYLIIEEKKEQSPNAEQSNYLFIKQKPSADAAPLRPFEAAFLDSMFTERNQITVNELHDALSGKIPDLQTGIYEQLVSSGHLVGSPRMVRTGYTAVAFFILIIATIIIFASQGSFGVIPLVQGLMLTFVVLWFAAYIMPTRSEKGSKAALRIIGFIRFVRQAHKAEIDKLLGQNANAFIDGLPYALVLGCADEWASHFQGMPVKHPQWFQVDSNGRARDVNASQLATGLGSVMRSIEASVGGRLDKLVSRQKEAKSPKGS